MARIKKRGLDCFPMNTDFIHDRLVRRIMKREGDAALTVLLGTLSCIYSGEGYYVRADDLFYDDLSDCLFQQEAEDVRRVAALAVEYGLFHAGLYAEYGILTSADIQRQYLFSTKRRDTNLIEPSYLLLDPKELKALSPGKRKKTAETEERPEAERSLFKDADGMSGQGMSGQGISGQGISGQGISGQGISRQGISGQGMSGQAPEMNFDAGTESFTIEKTDSMYFGTHSIAQNSIAQQSVAQNSKEQQTATANSGRGGDRAMPERENQEVGVKSPGNAGGGMADNPRLCRDMTDADIARMIPPDDSRKRNLEGLLESLRQYKVPVPEQYAIILKSNFGLIGHPVWKGICTLRDSHGKIRLPGRYLLSVINCPNG